MNAWYVYKSYMFSICKFTRDCIISYMWAAIFRNIKYGLWCIADIVDETRNAVFVVLEQKYTCNTDSWSCARHVFHPFLHETHMSRMHQYQWNVAALVPFIHFLLRRCSMSGATFCIYKLLHPLGFMNLLSLDPSYNTWWDVPDIHNLERRTHCSSVTGDSWPGWRESWFL